MLKEDSRRGDNFHVRVKINKNITLVCLGGVLPRVILQYALGFPTDCLKLLPRFIVIVSVPGRHCKRNSAFSWKRGGPDWIKNCSNGIASDAATDWALETSAGQTDQACLRRKSESSAASCVASEPVLSNVTRWGIISVAGSVALKRGKLPNNAFNAFKYSSLALSLTQISFSMAAIKNKTNQKM